MPPTSTSPRSCAIPANWPAALCADLKGIPAEAHVALEGGHFTAPLHLLRYQPPPAHRIAGYRPDTAWLFKTGPIHDKLRFLVHEVPYSDGEGCGWAICRPPAGEEIDVSELDGVSDAYSVDFAPTSTELATFEEACVAAAWLKTQVRRVDLVLLVGDLYLPWPTRRALGWLLPDAYKAALNRWSLQDDLVLLSEAKARNQGKRRVLDKAKKTLLEGDKADEAYARSGFALLNQAARLDESGLRFALYLTSELALSLFANDDPHMVALTKDEQTPACGLILAGRLLWLQKRGVTHLVTVYDETDDPRIKRKNQEGMLIASYLIPDLDLRAWFLTAIPSLDSTRAEPDLTTMDSRTIRSHGSPAGRTDLLERTRRVNNIYPEADLDRLCGDSCSVDHLNRTVIPDPEDAVESSDSLPAALGPTEDQK